MKLKYKLMIKHCSMIHSTMRRALAYTAVFMLVSGCATVPLDRPKPYSESIVDNMNTQFGVLVTDWDQINNGASGFYPLVQGMDALGVRLGMADKAEESIDLQYFLMKDDSAGAVLSTALLRAAERGVRIRFLLDDVFTKAPDSKLLALNEHPNIQVRLFNPISRKGLFWLNFAGQFQRANRRMHNKSFTVDNAISVVGGRNIADEYFQLKTDAVFADFDILTFGPVVKQISRSFDDFWNHDLAIPIEYLKYTKKDSPSQSPTLESSERIYRQALDSDLLKELETGERKLFVADARVIADDPEKLQNAVGSEHMKLAIEIGALVSNAESELIFISPYYIPGKEGIRFIKNIVDKDVRVVVVTNSLASTNQIAVHSAYSGYRLDVIRAGVELYEARADTGHIVQGGKGSEQLTLHTKLIVIDRRYLLVGSLNLDSRSIEINSEMGLLIDSPELAKLISDGLTKALPTTTYRIAENERGKLEWHSNQDGKPVINHSEPLSSRWRRTKAWMMKILPESQL